MFSCLGRPIINNKFEEKTCGDGPSLATMFEDDKHLQTIIHNIRVSPTILADLVVLNPHSVSHCDHSLSGKHINV